MDCLNRAGSTSCPADSRSTLTKKPDAEQPKGATPNSPTVSASIQHKSCRPIQLLPLMTTTVRLSDDTVVKNYANDQSFHLTMQNMSLKEANGLRSNIQKYPNEHPMPGMAHTADKIREGIALLQSYPLTAEERPCIERLHRELEQLEEQSPPYPYQQSLALSYRFLHFKAFLDFKFERSAFKEITPQHTMDRDCSCPDRKTCALFLKYPFKAFGIKRISCYSPKCTLAALEALPWHLMLSSDASFKNKLSDLYHSASLHRESNSGFTSLTSGTPLIPCAHELDITFFCKTALLPLWLTGFSYEDYTAADGLDMSPADFFDHDLFHLAMRNSRSADDWFDQPGVDLLSRFIKTLYKNSEKMEENSFSALELILFELLHEQGYMLSQYRQILQAYTSGKRRFFFADLPEQYENVTYSDLRRAASVLQQLLPKTECDDTLPIELKIEAAWKNAAEMSVEIRDMMKTYPVYSPPNPSVQALKKLTTFHERTVEKAGIAPARVRLYLNYYAKKREGWSRDRPYFDHDIMISTQKCFKLESQFVADVMKKDGDDLGESFIQACKTFTHPKHTIGAIVRTGDLPDSHSLTNL